MNALAFCVPPVEKYTFVCPDLCGDFIERAAPS